MSKSKPLLIVLALAVVAGCATGVKRPLPGCSDTAERRPLNPSHWPSKPPAVTPVAPAQDKARPAPTVGPAGQTPAGPTAGGHDHPGEVAPPPAATPAAPEPSTPKPPWWRRLLGAARSAPPTWECEVHRHE
jgi:hypothetical protein